MAPSVRKYFQDGLAPSTQKSYGAALKCFHTFCNKYNILAPFPVTEHLLCCFAAYLADEGLSPQTGRSYLSAVRSMQISLGLPDPRERSAMPALNRVLAGIKRMRLHSGPPACVRLPITALVLNRIREALQTSSNPNRVVLWAIFCLAFFGFFRLGELLLQSPGTFNPSVDLAWGDIAMDSLSEPRMLKVHLKKSKCDQSGAGVDVVVGRTSSALCPVTAMVQYVNLRQNRPGPFFISSSQEAVTKQQFVTQIRNTLTSIGLPPNVYAGHSFRIGAATTAALAGIEDSTIQSLGRWHSSAFLQYIRLPREQLASILAIMAQHMLPPSGSL